MRAKMAGKLKRIAVATHPSTPTVIAGAVDDFVTVLETEVVYRYRRM